MIWRTYQVLLPTNNVDVDIPVEGVIGPAPILAGNDGFFVEWRNRRIRVPVRAGAAGFVPRFALGFVFSITPLGAGATTAIPRVQFSQSLVGNVFSTAAGATTPGDETFADPAGAPTIRINTTTLGGQMFRLHLGICEAKDDDRSNQ